MHGFSRTCLGLICLLSFTVGPALAQKPVSRKEFEQLKARYEALQKSMESLQKKAVTEEGLEGKLDDLSDEITDDLRKDIDLNSALRPGTTSFLLSGYAQSTYTDESSGNGSFGATFNPIFLWRLNDKLAFEGEIELELGDTNTEVGLEYAQLAYSPFDFLTVAAGKFLNPFGVFRERLHPAWINKLPDKPLGYSGGANKLVPSTQVGVQARGGVPLPNDMELNYVLYVTNGPDLITDDPNKFGLLALNNFSDANTSKAVGGRLGFLPIPEAEIGFSFERSQVDPGGNGTTGADLLFLGVDANAHFESEALMGTVDLRSEYIRSSVDDITYDANGALGFGPARYNNQRTAFYVQVAYRATLAASEFLKNLEAVYRFDTIEHPNRSPAGLDERRNTLGLNYWMNSSTVFKLAFRTSDVDGGPDDDAVLMQWAMAF